MTHAMLPILRRILDDYGADAFTHAQRVNAILLDLAPGMTRERILVRNFVELGGYRVLTASEGGLPMVRGNLARQLTEQYALEPAAAAWVVELFAEAVGQTDTAVPAPQARTGDSPPNAPPAEKAAVAIGKAHTAAVGADGFVFAQGGNDFFQTDVGHWRNVVALAAGDAHTVGLRADGTVLAAGSNAYDQCDVGWMTDIASVYAFGQDTVCVKTDGRACAVGKSRLDLSSFENIRSVAWFPEGLFGIRADGTVAVAVREGAERDAEEIGWARRLRGAVQIISTYVNGTLALRSDRRIYKMNAPDNYFAQWRDVVSLTDLSDSFAILRADGTVRVLPYDRDQPRKPSPAEAWRDIVAIYGKYKRLVGLTSEGRLVSACTDLRWLLRNGPLDFLSDWYPIRKG